MATLYKLTNPDWTTYNNTKWGPGITHYGTGEGGLCSAGWIHAYTDPYLAVLLNPIHANYKNPCLWECRGEIARTDLGLKVGCLSLTTIKEIGLVRMDITNKIAFGILCAMEVYQEQKWRTWASGWLSSKNRAAASAADAASAASAAYAAAYAADAADAAASAADAAASAASAASDAADAASAAYAADAAAYAAASAASAPLNLHQLALEALKVQ